MSKDTTFDTMAPGNIRLSLARHRLKDTAVKKLIVKTRTIHQKNTKKTTDRSMRSGKKSGLQCLSNPLFQVGKYAPDTNNVQVVASAVLCSAKYAWRETLQLQIPQSGMHFATEAVPASKEDQ